MGGYSENVANHGWVPVPRVVSLSLSLSLSLCKPAGGILPVKCLNVSFLCRACVILGVIFLLSSLCIVIKAIHDLSIKLLPEVVRSFFFLNTLSCVPLFTVLLGKLGRWREHAHVGSPEELIAECELLAGEKHWAR